MLPSKNTLKRNALRWISLLLEIFYSEVQRLYRNLTVKNNKDLFYTQFYANLAQEGNKLFPQMKGEESSLLIIISCKKFMKVVEYLN